MKLLDLLLPVRLDLLPTKHYKMAADAEGIVVLKQGESGGAGEREKRTTSSCNH